MNVDEAQWLASGDPAAMVTFLTRGWDDDYPPNYPMSPAGKPSDRKLRLFAVACCRHPAVWDRLTDDAPCGRCGGGSLVKGIKPSGGLGWTKCPDCRAGRVNRSRRAVEVAERFADGEATEAERRTADADATQAACDADPSTFADVAMWVAEIYPAASGWPYYEQLRRSVEGIGLPPAAQADLLRCIFGNPYRNVELPAGALFSPTVLAISRRAYAERDFAALPVLADALGEAGCADAGLLGHLRADLHCNRCGGSGETMSINDAAAGGCVDCRGAGRVPATHARGCWVLDLILGKS